MMLRATRNNRWLYRRRINSKSAISPSITRRMISSSEIDPAGESTPSGSRNTLSAGSGMERYSLIHHSAGKPTFTAKRGYLTKCVRANCHDYVSNSDVVIMADDQCRSDSKQPDHYNVCTQSSKLRQH